MPAPKCYIMGGGINGLTALRSLSKRGISCRVFSTSPQDVIRHSKLHESLTVSDDADIGLANAAQQAAKESAKPVLLVTSDPFLRAADANRPLLDECFLSNLASSEAIRNVMSKHQMGLLADRYNLPVARTIGLSANSSAEDFERAKSLPLPVVLKPEDTSAQDKSAVLAALQHPKAKICNTQEELSERLDAVEANGISIVAQQFVDGLDSDHYSQFSYLDASGKSLMSFGVRKLRLNPVHAGSATCVELSFDADLAAANDAVLAKLDYRGLVSSCFKRDPTTGEFLCYEVNGRLPLSHAASELIGTSLAWAAYQDLTSGLDEFVNPGIAPTGLWLRLSGDVRAARDYRRLNELSIGQWLSSVLRVRYLAEWSWRDPKPALVAVRSLLFG